MPGGKSFATTSTGRKAMKGAAYALITFLLFTSCASKRLVVVDNWQDATLAANTRAELDQLKRDNTDLEQRVRDVSGRIDSITLGLNIGLARCGSLEELGSAIDRFVRELIRENTYLRSIVSTNSGHNEGTGGAVSNTRPGN